MKESYDPEKDVVVEKASRVSTSSLSEDVPPENDGLYANNEINDPKESLHRGLSARQISMIAVCTPASSVLTGAHALLQLGGAVGTGLIVGSGTALVRGGPLGILLGYAYVGVVCFMVCIRVSVIRSEMGINSRDTQVMAALGEMAAYLPHKKGFAGYATRFVDPAFGFALGWNYTFKYASATFRFLASILITSSDIGL